MTAPTLDALVAKWTARSKDAVKTLSMKAHFAARGNDWVVAQEMISCQEAIDTAALLATLESRALAADAARASAEAALADMIKTATLLQQNSVACAMNHYGGEIDFAGTPGWLVDTEKSIERARAALEQKP